MSKLHVFKNAEISATEQTNAQGGASKQERDAARARRQRGAAANKIARLLLKADRKSARIERGFLTDAQTKRNQMIVDRNSAAAIRIAERNGFFG